MVDKSGLIVDKSGQNVDTSSRFVVKSWVLVDKSSFFVDKGIPTDTLIKMADFFHTTTDFILNRTNERKAD